MVGTEGQLDRPEGEFAVRHLDDFAKRIKEKLKELNKQFPKFGWTMITATKLLTDKEVEMLSNMDDS